MEEMNYQRAVVLLSGGIDSAVTAAYAQEINDCEVHGLTISYGQRHDKEINCARKVQEDLGLESWRLYEMPRLVGSSLTGEGDIPNYESDEIPNTFVPARNIIFLSVATNLAMTLGAQHIYIGVGAVDYSGYPDCRPEFITAMRKAINIGTDTKIEIRTPIINMPKEQVIRIGECLGVNFSNTWSCYNGREKACGVCPSCRIRLRAFKEAELVDPIAYEEAIIA
jgi:7-cyano-7-deazaguanine synthase